MKHCFPIILLAAFFLSCNNEEISEITSGAPQAEVAPECVENLYVSGEAYVVFDEEMTLQIEAALAAGTVKTKSAGLNQTLDALGITSMRRLFPHAGEFESRARREGMHRWYVVEYSEQVTHTKAAGTFLAVDGVEEIVPVRRVKRNDTFNDLDSKLWGLNNASNPGFDINVLPVWEQYTTGNPEVIVAVVDGGVDLKHEDLAANCLSTGHYNAVNGTGTITPDEHGTHVAGVIAAVSNNGKGIAGIAGGDAANGKSGVKILSCQIFNDTDNGSTAEAIYQAANRGAVICQNSWGYNYDLNGDGKLSQDEVKYMESDVVSAADKAAIDYFIKYAGCDNDGNQLPNSPMKGGIVIFAAGNDAATNCAPANYQAVVAVGSIASDGTRSDFSNYGDWVDIAAPGTAIYSTVPTAKGGYASMDGTSMACPHVSGVAALVVSQYGGQGFTNEVLKQSILASSNRDILPKAYKVGGLLNAYGAFGFINSLDVDHVDPVTDLEVGGRHNNLDLTFTVTADSNGEPAYGFLVVYGTDKAAVEAATAVNYAKVKVYDFEPKSGVGTEAKCTIPKLDFETKYYVKVLAHSWGGLKYAEASAVMEAETGVNTAPEITVAYEGSRDLKPIAAPVKIPVLAADPDGDNIEVTYVSGSEADTFEPTPDGTWMITILGYAADEGTYTAKVTATDEYGLATVEEFTYTILPNKAPVKVIEIDNVLLPGKGREFTIDMSKHVTEPDGDVLVYEVGYKNQAGQVEKTSKVLHALFKKGQLIGSALGYGLEEVEVKAKDARGEAAVFNFKVQVKDPENPLSVYPNPVTDYVNIGTLEEASTHIKIVSQTGKTVYDEKLDVVSGFDPARIDMSGYAPGIYIASVTFDGKEYKQTFVKL